MEYAIFWLANGFDPQNPAHTDQFSQTALTNAAKRYRELKSGNNRVYFPIVKSVVRDKSRKIFLYDTLWNDALLAGVQKDDLIFTSTETTGSPTDGLAITRFSKKCPAAVIELYPTTIETAE